MGKKLLPLLALIIGTLVMITAMNQSFINKIKQEKYFAHLKPAEQKGNILYKTLFLESDRWRYGDLYGLCYLPGYKFPLEPFKEYKHKVDWKPSNRILYIIGDSFLADKTLYGAFDGFDNVIFLDRRFSFGPIALDSTKQNYMLMEFAERNLVGYDISTTDEALVPAKVAQSGLPVRKKSDVQGTQGLPTSIQARLSNIIFNKDLNRNLELVLFDNKITTPFKQLKASLNYALFKRLPKEIAMAGDNSRLFLNITVDTANTQSAFRPIPDTDVKQISQNLDNARRYYLTLGFKDVFLSAIPNAVSIYDAQHGPYNHLLKRVEQTCTLKKVSLFNAFKNSKANVFYRSDAHWNPLGMDIWVNQTNTFLAANTH
ncbi:hypothetical protein [Mucilaginibacter gilvus]|uniref:AlgX/AlgJ SGNH hydrolase-like domain-containing protein n=1 Tax=Mucilaginibacter gilvus TaxID=2305909 RepID=A0A444MUL3_9SPHI|nr:hypothetical protein [Mucilaginibacter gilvus]RWY57330.1 hypothetical protein EPL05_02005 [Mucilaginibacter gilvus]